MLESVSGNQRCEPFIRLSSVVLSATCPAINELVERQRQSRVDSHPFCSGGAADCGGDFSRPRTLICGMSMIQRAEGD